MLKTIFKTILFLALAALMLGSSLLLGQASFRSLAKMRELERVPRSSVRSVLEGEINLRGQVQRAGNILQAPRTGTRCVYYRYTIEREERDSDGDRTWRTIRDDEEFVPFLLQDDTGSIRIVPSGNVKFAIRQSWTKTEGDLRYTEWRLEVGENVFTFGYAEQFAQGFEVGFTRSGHYTPILSEYGETSERTGMAGGSIAACWLGLVLLAGALSLLISSLRVHRLLVLFSVLNLAVTVYLVLLGLQMMKLDLRAAVDRLNRQEEATRQEILQSQTGRSWNGDWETFPETVSERVQELRLNLARATHRVRMQRNAFPERFLAPLWRIPRLDPFPLPPAQAEKLMRKEEDFETAKVPPLMGWVLIGAALVAGATAFHFGFRRVRFKRCMENLPTSGTAGAVYGLGEFKGEVVLGESANALRGPLSNRPCVQYHYKVQEKRTSGKKTRWVTIANEQQRIPFLCRDREGTLLIDPTGAEIYTSHKSRNSIGNRRYTETRLELGDPLYAIGECVLDPASGERLYLRKPEGSFPFLLGNRTESQILLKVAQRGIFYLNVSFAAILLMVLLLFGLTGSFAATDYLAAALTAPFFMTLVTLMLHYNDLVFLRERVRRNRSNIDVSLQKRHDLVPQLQTLTQALQDHERDLQQRVVELRNGYDASTVNLEQKLEAGHGAVSRLIASLEDYPDLISQPQTALLMRSLISLENEIALMRNGYNDAVETYNSRIQTVPDVFFAKLFQFKDMPLLFDGSEVIRIPPSVQALWEQEQRPDPSAEPTEAEPPPANPVAVETPATLLAAARETPPAQEEDTRLPDVGKLQELLFRGSEDPMQTLDGLEAEYEGLRNLSPPVYRMMRGKLRQWIESDRVISLTELAVIASVKRNLDPSFGMVPERPVRHRDFSLLVEPVNTLLSLIAHTKATPETAEAAFRTGVDNLNHPDKEAFGLREISLDNLAAFEQVLEDIAHATPMIRANILYACEAAVKMNGDATEEQLLVLRIVADWLDRPRPA